MRVGENLIIGAAVGSGISAVAAETGGADFLLAINAGRCRNMGSPSIACMLPTHNANDLSLDFAVNEILPRSKLPVLIGVAAWDGSNDAKQVAQKVRDLGFAGAVNFPSTMHYSQEMRQILDYADLGTRKEVEILSAVQDLGLDTLYYCGSRGQARFAAEAGLRQILFNFGWNGGGQLGHTPRLTLEESSMVARDIGRLVKSINPEVRFFLEGGPVISSDDLGFVARHAPLDGYVGGSTLDRLPFEGSVANRIAGYKGAKATQRHLEVKDQKRLDWSKRFGFVGHSAAMLDFLKRLFTLAHTKAPFAIVIENGGDEAPIVNAIRSRTRKSTLLVDPLQTETPLQATRTLLGAHNASGFTLGALFRNDIGQVVLKNPHLLNAAAQRRLASALTLGAAPHPKHRGFLPVAARLVCLVPHQLDACPSLDPALRDVFKGWSIKFPELRERADDILMLLESLLSSSGLPAAKLPKVEPAAMLVFRGYRWPGNEQELKRLVGTMVQRFAEQAVTQADARAMIDHGRDALGDAPTGNDERRAIADALSRNGFHKGNTAKALGISRKTLYNKLLKYQITT